VITPSNRVAVPSVSVSYAHNGASNKANLSLREQTDATTGGF
jgi:hypothetical protein